MDTLVELIEFFNIEVDAEKTIKSINKVYEISCLTSVDLSGIYHGEFNLGKYIICILHLISFISITLFAFLFIEFDSIYILFDSEFLPEKFRVLLTGSAVLLLLTIAIRFDCIIAEWKNKLSVLSFMYYVQENISSKHGLTWRNYNKLVVLGKILELFVIKGCVPLLVIVVYMITFYVAIKANLILYYLFVPLVMYTTFYCAITMAFFGMVGIIILYYYILLFDQINVKTKLICKRSEYRISMINQKRLIRLIDKHNSIAVLIYQNNFFTRRILVVFFITLALAQIIPLNLFLKTHLLYMKILYINFLFVSLSFGFTVAYFLSLQISIAHKPYKLIYSLLTKQGISYRIKWKV